MVEELYKLNIVLLLIFVKVVVDNLMNIIVYEEDIVIFLHLKQTPKFAKHYLRRARLRARYRFDGRSSRRHKKEESESEEEWDPFPMRGSSEERRYCIMKWNKLLNERREKQKKKEKKNHNNEENNNDNNSSNNNINTNKTNNEIMMKNINNGVSNANQNNNNNSLLQSLPLVPPQSFFS